MFIHDKMNTCLKKFSGMFLFCWKMLLDNTSKGKTKSYDNCFETIWVLKNVLFLVLAQVYGD